MLDNKGFSNKIFLIIISAILLGLLMIKPYNLLCKFTNKCQPIIISYYFPNKIGTQYYEIFYEIKNNDTKYKNIETAISSRSQVVLPGEKMEIFYKIKNLSDEDIIISFKSYFYPSDASKYVKIYNCLCFSKHKIKKNQEIILPVKYYVDSKIEEDEVLKYEKNIRFGYQIIPFPIYK